MFTALLRDEGGFIVSAELVLVVTLLVVGMIVGLSEVQHAVVSELNDVGDAVGQLNQSFMFSGFAKRKGHGKSAYFFGSSFRDSRDDCDNNQCDIACDGPVHEGPKMGGND